LKEQLLASVAGASGATRSFSGTVMQKISELIPEFIGGSADLSPSTSTGSKGKRLL